MLPGRVGGGRGEERADRRLELGRGIGLAACGDEELPAVDQAGPAPAQKVGTVVAEIAPLAALDQTLGAGARDQLIEIRLPIRGGGRAAAGDGQNDQGEAGQRLARTTPGRVQANT
jgi:hypothetical protein